jgi:hypothetical protein
MLFSTQVHQSDHLLERDENLGTKCHLTGHKLLVYLLLELYMSRLTAVGVALILACASAPVLADAKSHAADAERFLLLARADKLAVPVYGQVQGMFAQRFAEQELKDLIRFYESPLGKKVMEQMPMLTARSAQLTQGKLESAVPKVNQLLDEMTGKLGGKKQ